MGSATNDWTALTVVAVHRGMSQSAEDQVGCLFTAGQGTTVTHTFASFERDSDTSMERRSDYRGLRNRRHLQRCDGNLQVRRHRRRLHGDGLDAKGAITAIGADDSWIFTPDAGATSDVADANYLSYGFWLKRTTDADGVLTYNEVETFARAEGHAEETGDSDLSQLSLGSATYEGGSVGVYVKNVLDDQANIVSATSGHFSADVELTATFGGGDVADNNKFTIGGKITDFVLQHGEENDWAVGLGLADFSGGRMENGAPGKSAPGSSHNNEFSGEATGDSTAAAGSWNGAFYGSSADCRS